MLRRPLTRRSLFPWLQRRPRAPRRMVDVGTYGRWIQDPDGRWRLERGEPAPETPIDRYRREGLM
jgi:hypothetical protein